MFGIEPSAGIARFEGFELDVRTGELRNPEGDAARLSEQPLRILLTLLERPGELVLREDLRKRLWPNDTVVEFEHSINAAVNRLRQALGDAAESPKFIETLARRGYRWKTQVQWEHREVAPPRPKPPDGSLIGKRVAHYRVLEVLGGGGMGVVYKAEDIKLGRRVALKFLPEELAADPGALQRFEREARVASSLNHPNIYTIYAIEEYERQSFISMELLEGRTLRDVVAETSGKEPLPLLLVLNIGVQIARGLAAAHQHGIIHRDIKPANILVTNQGQVKVLDFGLAKLHELDVLESQSPVNSKQSEQPERNPLLTLTRTGVTVGTAAYMSPEQVRGEKLDARTDIFSFGLVIYEMVTAQRAFPGDSAPALHHAILTQTPKPARELNARIPAKLEGLINRAIDKHRDSRYETVDEICRELEALQHSLARKRSRKLQAAALATAGLLVVGALLSVLNRPPKMISAAPDIKLRQLTTNSSENPVIGGAISPDGKYLQYSDAHGLHLKSIDTGETRDIAEPHDQKAGVKWSAAIWFPDSTRFLVNAYPAIEDWNEWSSATSSIWTVSMLGGEPKKIRDHAGVCGISPDGSTISFATNRGKHGEQEVWLMGPNGEQARQLSHSKEGTGMDCWGWSPDGKYYGWVLNEDSGTKIVSQKASGGPVVTLFGSEELKKINDIVWLHDGRVLYDRAEAGTGVCNYWMGRIDPDTGKRLEQPRRLTNWPKFCVSSGSVTQDDKKVTFDASSGFLTTDVSNLDNGKRLTNTRHFTEQESDAFVVGWTPDSKSLIIGQHLTPDDFGLYRQSLDSQAPNAFLSPIRGGGIDYGVVTADGKWLMAFIWPSQQPFSGEPFVVPFPIMRFPLSGGAPEQLLQVSRPAIISCPRVRSKTCVIAEESKDRKQVIISELDPIQGRGAQLTHIDLETPVDWSSDNFGWVISPDGTQLAILQSQGAIEIHPLQGGPVRKIKFKSSERIVAITWAADQQGLFLTRRAPGGNELLYLDLLGHFQSVRKCNATNACFSFPSPDGHHVAILDRRQTMNMWMMENF